MLKKLLFILCLVGAVVLLSPQSIKAETQLGRVQEIVDEITTTFPDGSIQTIYQLQVILPNGETTSIETQQRYQPNDQVLLETTQFEDTQVSTIVDYVRILPLSVLAVLFIGITIMVARFKGARALLSLIVSFGFIFGGILPQLLRGAPPVPTAILGAIGISLATFPLSHGFKKSTGLSLLATAGTLVLTGLLSSWIVWWARLSGGGTEEVQFLLTTTQNSINGQGLLLAGILLGTLGVLDDITISQVAVVRALTTANPTMTKAEKFWQSMKVGTDHIGSLVNTLVLVYTGSALPLLLLFIQLDQPLWQLVNYQPVAEEIVRTLSGSIGLILAVPLSTWLAVTFLKNTDVNDHTHTHHHHH